MLNDWSIIKLPEAIQFIIRCQHYEGAFAQEPRLESHAGSTYCAVAALSLANKLDSIPHKDRLKCWLLSRQVKNSGFQGRVEKEPDTCYSFWCGASAMLLGCHSSIDAVSDIRYLLSAQSPMGGIAKVPDAPPDVLHSYLSYVALSMHQHDQNIDTSWHFAKVDPSINLSEASLDWLRKNLWTTS
ncbi:protein geranylgeranyltransferase type I [Malassezia psittaci]|uniref:Protein geranylgeranyltransferase type I n=1 Tax=Malassezia psittaci TaxID=1821823 RepID=A0AAF0F924_9BASI|nr:protein geranylgeranyltransferase type I [Malassezia psittaci]